MIECKCIAEAHTYGPNCHVDVNKTNLKSLWPIRCVTLSIFDAVFQFFIKPSYFGIMCRSVEKSFDCHYPERIKIYLLHYIIRKR